MRKEGQPPEEQRPEDNTFPMTEPAYDMKAGDPVRIVPYDPAWPHLFARLGGDLRAALGSVAVRIDHIGSTAVPGLVAKPVIDMQISVAAFEPLTAYRLPLERLGYVFRADNTERTKRYFREAPGAAGPISTSGRPAASVSSLRCSFATSCAPTRRLP